ncbi:MAG TPA: hypothetical protein VHW65_02810, partial [Gemmatimonadales bacterium]|nr:hypothetical protein [Gemmatimonadales bacterium]
WRIDAAHPGTIPDYNPVVDTVFGLHTNRVPNDVGFSPRLGFSWTSKGRRGIGTAGGSSGPLSGLSAAQLSSFPPELLMSLLGNARASTTSQPGIGVNGSVGAYKNSISIYSISSLVDQTGLPNTRRTLSCVGPATPIPDWSNLNNAPPDDCLDGTGPAAFSTNTPTVRVYDPSFRAPITWRGNLGVDGIRVPFKWVASLTGTLSYGVDGQSSLDLNLNRTPGFMLGGGDDRPVYVTPANIVTGTGAVAPGAYRIDPDFGSVSNTISDIHSYSENMAFTLVPPRPLLHGKITTFQFTYSWLRTETESRAVGNGGGSGLFCSADGICSSFGGGAGTAGDPFLKEWVPGSSPTHTFTLLTGFRAWWFNLNIRTSVWSGYPFTPMVSGDINGDGSSSDDRAYVPNPANTTDPVLAAQIRQLLTSGTSAAQSCLLSQMGRIAGANTCHTPWQVRLDLAMNFNPPSSWGYGDRLRFTTSMVNASSALVRLLDLENTPLGQSIASPTPNSTLLYVTGFDPATNQFKYQVNQLFGQPINFGSARHKLAPFQVQVGVQYQLGGPATQPMSRGMGFIPPGKEPPLTIDQIKQRVTKLARNPVPAILALKDTLRLTPAQVKALDSINTHFKAKSDSMLAPLTTWLIKKGRHVDDAGLSSRLNKVQPSLTKLAAEASKGSNGLLTPGQRALMPRPGIGGAPGAVPPGALPRGAPTQSAPPNARPGAVPVGVPLRTGGGGGGD